MFDYLMIKARLNRVRDPYFLVWLPGCFFSLTNSTYKNEDIIMFDAGML